MSTSSQEDTVIDTAEVRGFGYMGGQEPPDRLRCQIRPWSPHPLSDGGPVADDACGPTASYPLETGLRVLSQSIGTHDFRFSS